MSELNRQEMVSMLRRSVTEWNAWRAQNPDAYIDMDGANLRRAYLCEANLRRAYLCEANLRRADLCEANLCGANLCEADLCEANLRGADLRRANLCEADLCGANLCETNLCETNLREANLRGANLRGADLPPFQICPEEGAFIAWKKTGAYLAKLEIPSDTQRTSSLIGRKCRAERVRVVALYGPDDYEHLAGVHACGVTDGMGKGPETEYRVGQTVEADGYDDDIRVECAHGIHFFVTRAEAELW